ncbi:PKD-like family lipoprotein [Sphingobacterium lactis]|uniref:PKD-like family lipoprotein n=1 Tax=Sphingobacterium lactis TaxID=797291 RepID=UPI003F7ED2FA
MKTLKLLLLSLIVISISSCSKDLGNYKYHDVNEVLIDGLKQGVHNSERIYELAYNDTLKLKPTFRASIEGSDMSQLTFLWKIDGKLVSESNELIYIGNTKYGKLHAEFTVSNGKTGVDKKYNFYINVSNPFMLGYFVLAKDANNASLLYCKTVGQEKLGFQNVVIPNYPLGTNPVGIEGLRVYGSSGIEYYNNLVIAVQNSRYPVFQLESRDFVPNLLYSSNSFVGDKTNFVFEPTEISMDRLKNTIYAVNRGKMHVLQHGAIGLPALYNDPLDYEIPLGGLGGNHNESLYYFTFYDAKNKRIRVMDNGSRLGIPYSFINSFDDITDPAKYPNQTYVTSQLTEINSARKFIYLMREGNRIFSYLLGYSSANKPNSFERIASGPIPGDGNINVVYFETGDTFWYLANAKTIYRASHLGLEFQEHIKLPNDAPGHITKFKRGQGKLMIATYDAGYSGEKKGSIYIYNDNTLKLEQALPHSVEEVVGLYVGI